MESNESEVIMEEQDDNLDLLSDEDETEDEPDESTQDDSVVFDSNGEIVSHILDYILDVRIDGLYDDKHNKTYSKRYLAKHPPRMVFSKHRKGDDTGEDDAEVSMLVNKALANRLKDIFTDTVNAYNGISKEPDKKKFSIESMKESLNDAWTYHPLKLIGTVAAIIVIIAITIFSIVIS